MVSSTPENRLAGQWETTVGDQAGRPHRKATARGHENGNLDSAAVDASTGLEKISRTLYHSPCWGNNVFAPGMLPLQGAHRDITKETKQNKQI